MALADAVQGARHTAQSITWQYPDGTAVDLTGATLTGFKRSVETGLVTALDGSLNINDAVNGVFSWTYGAADVGSAGKFLVQFIATYGASNLEKTLSALWTVHEALDVAG